MGQSRIDTHCASVQFCSLSGVAWWLTCVYGPQDNQAKIQFLQKVRDLRVTRTGPWLVAGDFNLIYKVDDKNNTNLNRALMGWFRRWINDMGVAEVPLHGRKFTWSSSSTSADPTLERLDLVFCLPDWVTCSQDASCKVQLPSILITVLLFSASVTTCLVKGVFTLNPSGLAWMVLWKLSRPPGVQFGPTIALLRLCT